MTKYPTRIKPKEEEVICAHTSKGETIVVERQGSRSLRKLVTLPWLPESRESRMLVLHPGPEPMRCYDPGSRRVVLPQQAYSR